MMTLTEDRFSKNLTLSIGFHIAVLSVFSIKAYFFATEPITFEQALKVDIIALPDKIQPNTQKATEKPKEPPKKELPKPEPKPEPAKPKIEPKKPEPAPAKPVAKTPTKKPVSTAKRKSQQSDALRKLQAQAALDRLRTLPEKAPPPEPPPKVEFKGNVLSAGTSLTGTQRLQQDQYISTMRDHVAKNWFLPEWLAKSNFKAVVEIKMDKNGSLLSYEISESSGNPAFDQLVLTTVEKSHPFPKPPEKFTEIFAVKGVLLGFPE